MNTKGMVQDWKWTATFMVVLIAAGFTVLYGANYMGLSKVTQIINPSTGAPIVQITQQCGSTGIGAINFREKNDLNLTSTEWGADVLYVYMKNADGSMGNLVGTITSAGSTSYAKLNATCGAKYVGYILSSATATAQITSVDQAPGVTLNADGGVDIDMNNQNIYITAHKTGVPSALQFRLFDVDNNAYVYNLTMNATYHVDTAQTTDWQSGNATFSSVTATSTGRNYVTNMTMANNGQYTFKIYVRAKDSNGQFNADRDGVIIAAQAPVNSWANVALTGSGATPITTAQLTAPAQKYFSNYQYFWKTSAALANTPNTEFTLVLKAQPSVDTTSWKCPKITFAARGSYLGTTTGYMTLHSMAKDDSSYTSVYYTQSLGIQGNCAWVT